MGNAKLQTTIAARLRGLIDNRRDDVQTCADGCRAAPSTMIGIDIAAVVLDDDLFAAVANARQALLMAKAERAQVASMDIPPVWEHATWEFPNFGAAHQRLDEMADDGWELVSAGSGVDGKVRCTVRRRRRDRFAEVQF